MPTIEVQEISPNFNLAIIVSRFNEEITSKLLEGALKRLEEKNFNLERVTTVWVPGAIEIPLAAQRLARTGKFEAIICLGLVINGETRHFDYVCEQVSQGCQHVALSNDIPVIFGVLTTLNLQQAIDRSGGIRGNMGCNSVDALLEFVSVLNQL